MADTSSKSENISIANLKAISSFEASCRNALTAKLDDQKRKIENAYAILNEKRVKIEADEQAKREKQLERARIEKERDDELRASIASFEESVPVEVPVKVEVKQPKEEPKPESKPVPKTEVVSEKVQKPEPVAENVVTKEEKPVEKEKPKVAEAQNTAKEAVAPAKPVATQPAEKPVVKAVEKAPEKIAQEATPATPKSEQSTSAKQTPRTKQVGTQKKEQQPVAVRTPAPAKPAVQQNKGKRAESATQPTPATATQQPAAPKKLPLQGASLAAQQKATAQPKLSEEHVETDAERRRKEQASVITNSIFAKPKKSNTEKPVIRIFVPTPTPEYTKSDKRKPYNSASGSGTSSSSGRSFSQGGFAPRTQGGKPIMMPPPIAMPTNLQGKKRGVPPKSSHGPADETEDKNPNKKARSRYTGGPIVEYDESGEITRIRTRKTAGDKHKNNASQPQQIVIDHAVLDSDTITIKALSEKIGKTGVEIIKQLFLLGIIKTINDTIDFDTADLVAGELGITLELQKAETSEEKVIAAHEDSEDDPADLVARPPIVTIMGHVDHGKTSILDYIRSANVAAGEAGGITQHIGAYSISVKGQQITFLDTPGHAAFTAMRARGANCTDIAIIVVAADDGIMPQTIEAINHAKAAGVQIIVAINKMDKPTADPDRIMTALTEYELIPEEWGGSVPVCKVSAKTGAGIKELLETILINAEVMELRANPKRLAKGVVIEAKLDKGKGPMATILVQNGTLHVSDYLVAGSVTGKVRAMQDDKGRPVKSAGPSMAVSVLGLQDVPFAGDQLLVVEDEKLMKEVADLRAEREKEKRMNESKVSLDDVFKNISDGKMQTLNMIIKTDVQGSVEALRDSMLKLSNDEVKVNIVHAVAGAINESDVMLADTTNSIIIGFNVRMDSNAKALAERDNIDVRLYRVIYDAIDDVSAAIKGLLAPKFREQYLGKAEIRVVYKISGVGSIAGCMVKDGKIVRNAKARVIRDNIVVCETGIASLKRMKDDVKEVVAGYECGIGLDNFNDIKEGDIIESFSLVQE